MVSSDESDESTTAASSPLKSVASSPFKADWSSPIKQADGSSPLRSLASSPLAGSPSPSRPIRNSSLLDTQSFAKRKKYEFYDPVVQDPSYKFWPAAAVTTEASTSGVSVQHSGGIEEVLNDNEQHETFIVESRSDTLNDNLSFDRYELTESSSEDGSGSSSSSEADMEAEERSSSEEDCESVQSSSASETIDSDDEQASSDDSDPCESQSPEVFAGCSLTVDEGVLMLMELFLKHKMEKLEIGDILKRLLKFFPKVHNMPRSQHLLFKYVKDLIPLPSEKLHFYCADCLYYLGCDPKKCDICQGEVSHKFFQLSIAAQIKNLFENHGLADMISKYSDLRQASCQDENVLYDLCDGSLFKGAKVDSPFSLTLLAHTDGISIHDSADLTLWPLEFVIAELPPELRYKYVIVSGIWLDQCKPYMNTYLKPFVEELETIATPGVAWTHPQTKELHVSPITVPGFCADCPARAQVQNILSHGGKHCCNICEQKTKKLPAEPVKPGVKKKPRRRVFTFEEHSHTRLRTSERMEVQGKESRRRQHHESRSKKLIAIKGVRGMSLVSNIPGCDRSSVVYPEYMHLLLCLIKEFFVLWFEKDGPWSLKDKRDAISAFLVDIRVPDFLTRIPRPTECFSKWKANELRSFLLYYSAIILKDCMKDNYFQHWLLLVQSLYLLLQDRVTETDIAKAEVMLRMFCRDFSTLYKADYYTYYVHNLLHLPFAVRRYGPLWSNSAFQFESFNGILAKFIHGTKNQAQELINNVLLAAGIEILKARVNKEKPLCDGQVELCNEVKKIQFSAEEQLLLTTHHFKAPYKVFYRAKLSKHNVITSLLYSRQKKRSNFTISFFNNATNQIEYGDVKCFVGSPHNPNLKVALVHRFAVDHLRVITHNSTGMILQHLIPIIETNNICLVQLSNITGKVIKVRDFLCLRPNQYEVNL